MKRKRIATAKFTAQTYGQEGPTADCSINVGMHLIFLHRTDDGLSTHFALEHEIPKWKSEGKNKRPIELFVATEIFDTSTSETG
jgi:hypothetical protein